MQILAYFQAYGANQGHDANMVKSGYQRIHKNKQKNAIPMGEKGWTKHVKGRRYFVTYGAMRGGARMTAKGEPDSRTQHLAPGIWAASGTGGVNVQPVLMFVRQGTYTPRLDMDKVAKRADVDNYLPRRLRYRIKQVAGV